MPRLRTLLALLVLPLALALPARGQISGPGLPTPPPQDPGTPLPGEPPTLPGTPPQVPGTPPPGEPPTLPGTPPQVPSANAVRADVRVILQGAYDTSGGALMRTDLEAVLPLAQPYGAAPWNYAGTESFAADLLDRHAVVDWVLVCLRPSPEATDVACRAALLLASGSLLDPVTESAGVRFGGVGSGAYHLVVLHRSHLAAMTSLAASLTDTAPLVPPDLTVSGAFGTNATAPLAGGRFGLWAGDGDASGSILAPDQQSVWLPTVGQAGYLAGDFDLDGSVLANDQQVFWLPNVGVQSAVPGAASLTSGEPTPEAQEAALPPASAARLAARRSATRRSE